MVLSDSELGMVRDTIAKLEAIQAKEYDRAYSPIASIIASRAEAKKRYAARNPWLARQNTLRHFFGIDIPEYERLLASQSGVCAICACVCPSGKRLAVDHCHATGKVRGLLCMRCNTGLGKFDDRIDLLEAAKSYLTKAGSGESRL